MVRWLWSWLSRLVFASFGGALGALLVALVEARTAGRTVTGPTAPSFGALVLGDFGVLVPMALLLGGLVGAATIYLEPDRMRSLGEHAHLLRTQPLLARSRAAAMAPLLLVATFVWCLFSATLAQRAFVSGEPVPVGVALTGSAVALLLALLAGVAALVSPLRRVLAAGAGKAPLLVDPLVTAGAGLVVVVGLFAFGVASGDESGGGSTPLAIFGVLKRGELDLRPLVNLVVIAACAYLAPMALSNLRSRLLLTVVTAALVMAGPMVTYREARGMNDNPTIATAIERGAPLGKMALGLLRAVTDRDHDGFSPLFAGGDCNDHDRDINPNAIDIPGDGIDQDCSGEDTPVPAPAPTATEPPLPPAGTTAKPERTVDRDLNLVFITVDTLRPDVGFMGYTAHDTTPNLDKLAAKSVVYDRAYSMASYTGKALAPILIGKYPSETARDGGHFNTYSAANTFLADRLREAGLHTMGAGTHWYFKKNWGLSKGMDVWDTSAIPGGGQGQEDTSVTSPGLTDAAIKMLSNPENTSKRFFLWLHYFDPHAQYVAHADVGTFPPGPNNVSAMRAAYDGEIRFTDHHVGRLLEFVESQPWGKDTAIVLTSDHGEAFLEHKMAYHGYEIWDELVRIPLLFYVPGAPPHHVPVKRSHIDITPTILQILRVPLPAAGELSGVSLLPEIFAEEGSTFAERDVLVDMPDGPNTKFRRALIHGTSPGMKLIHFGGNRYELYDLAADPGETSNLAQDAEQMKAMKAAFLAKKAELKEIYVKPDEPN